MHFLPYIGGDCLEKKMSKKEIIFLFKHYWFAYMFFNKYLQNFFQNILLFV